ncbi:MAG TPA: TonB-dependent receptor [Steroidobacteraceae bacterium]|nr:TonB-dependent receptor [Steroidobacteraceae bacterium]
MSGWIKTRIDSRSGYSPPAQAILGLLLAAAGGWAKAAPVEAAEGPLPPLPEVLVIGTTPVPGLRVDADNVPGNAQSLSAAELRQDGTSNIISALSTRLGSVNVNDTLADPFQPDILYRGFEASPVLGTPQGLAVYQNGVRINEAFGDTVNWDLFPDIAVNRIDIVSATPLYGLNALGGAMAVTMKNGFTFQGADGELSGGSFNQRAGAAEFGFNNGNVGVYAAARVSNQDGWRLYSEDSVHQYYLDLSWHAGGASIDLSYARADNRLHGQGAAPVQSLAINPQNVFTGPQDNLNTLNFVTLNASYAVSDSLAVQGILYSRDFRQTVANGNRSNYTACTGAAAGSLCQGDGLTPLTTAAGAPIPDISNAGAQNLGENDYETINSQGYGASLQLTSSRPLQGHGNEFAVGATVDGAETNFFSGTELGVINAELTVVPSGLFVYTAEGSVDSNGYPTPATPVELNANNKYYGFYATDTFDVGSLLAVTASGRYNIAKVDLSDQRGTALNGNNRFTHFNPALGAAYKRWRHATIYAGYSTNNRAPTASEIECSNPLQPCLLPTSLAGDPPNLRQVIAHTAEVGLRGQSTTDSKQARLSWNASVFRTNLEDDIYGISTSVSTGFFSNIGSTRRQGFETGLNYRTAQWSTYAQYSYIDATFRSPLTLNSPSNPLQDANGNIHVAPGDRLPLIPRNRIKIGADYSLLHQWSLGASLVVVTDSFYKGDESNQNPPLPGYHVVNLRTSYRVNEQLEFFANVQNLFDARYSTYGLFSDPTGVGAPGIPANANSNDPRVDNRFQSPAMPRSYFGGIRISF